MIMDEMLWCVGGGWGRWWGDGWDEGWGAGAPHPSPPQPSEIHLVNYSSVGGEVDGGGVPSIIIKFDIYYSLDTN